jgi:hypothetical protein
LRVLSHWLMRKSTLRRRFPPHALTAIEDAVERSEREHRAEIRVSIEIALDWRDLSTRGALTGRIARSA